ncbi:MAG TPA: alpha/beta fold hydrolase [Polyangiaceae bacterium]|nr:alpha/beta fold hydrolase [Polyangiaceae bacterium]
MSKTVLIVPGWGGSGEEHWQTLWQLEHGYRRVEQVDWERPDLETWLAPLEAEVNRAPSSVVLVAHSLGCALVAHYARRNPASLVAAALLVAPADVDSEMHTPDDVRCFSPLPMDRLPFPSVVVASRTDPYVRFARATEMANAWGARLVDVGRQGHINVDAGVGRWDAGFLLLEELLSG